MNFIRVNRRTVRWSVFILVLVLFCDSNAFCYTDQLNKFSIQFPKKWKISKNELVGKISVSAIEPKSEAEIVIAVAPNYINSPELLTGDFAKIAAKAYRPMIEQLCSGSKLLDAGTLNIDGYQALQMMYRCDNDFSFVMFLIPHADVIHSIVYNGSVRLLMSPQVDASINSFRILK